MMNMLEKDLVEACEREQKALSDIAHKHDSKGNALDHARQDMLNAARALSRHLQSKHG